MSNSVPTPINVRWILALAITLVLVFIPATAYAQTPADDQYGSPTGDPGSGSSSGSGGASGGGSSSSGSGASGAGGSGSGGSGEVIIPVTGGPPLLPIAALMIAAAGTAGLVAVRAVRR